MAVCRKFRVRFCGVLAFGAALGLAGCSNSGTGGGLEQVMSGLSAGPKAATAQKQRFVLVAMPSVAGGPPAFRKTIARQMNDRALAHNVALVVDGGVTCEYTLRGYMLTQRDGSGVKLLYVWDLQDSKGERINRFSGETASAAPVKGGDDWAAIPAAATDDMAEKALASIIAQKQIAASLGLH